MSLLLNPTRFAATGGGGGGSFVGAETATFTDDTAPAVTRPAGVQEGDLLLFWLITRNGDAALAGPEGGGWTVDHRDDISSDEFWCLAFKVAGGSEPASYSWAVTDEGTQGGQAAVAAFRDIGAKQASAYNKSASTATVLDAPSVAGTDGGLLVCGWGCAFDTDTYDAVPAGMAEAARVNTGGASTHLMVAYELLTSTGATGARSPSASGTMPFQGVGSVSFSPSA